MDKQIEEQLDYVEQYLFGLEEFIIGIPLPAKLSKEIFVNLLKVRYLICRYRTLEFDWDKKDWDEILMSKQMK